MVEAFNRQVEHEGDGEFLTIEAMTAQYDHLQRCDPDHDIMVAELAGAYRAARIAGYARTTWDDMTEGFREYWLTAKGDPAVPGLGMALLDWVERRALEVAATHVIQDRRLATDSLDGGWWHQELVRRRFTPRRYFATMVRSGFDDIPYRPLPDGVETRPVETSHLRAIWEADIEAFRDHNDYVEQTEADWEKFRDEAKVGTQLWHVAWAGDVVVGQVRTRSSEEETMRLRRRRAWTEDISTRRQWRKKGVASALISASLRQLGGLGFEEAALGVDTDNPTGAYGVYESLGYQIARRGALYERPV